MLILVRDLIFILIIFAFFLNRTSEALWIDGDVTNFWHDVVLAFFVMVLFYLSGSGRGWNFMSISFLVWSYGNFLYKRLTSSLGMVKIPVLTLSKICELKYIRNTKFDMGFSNDCVLKVTLPQGYRFYCFLFTWINLTGGKLFPSLCIIGLKKQTLHLYFLYFL